LQISAWVVTQEAVITITNPNPEGAITAREASRKSSSRLEELLETPFPQAAREFAEKTVDRTWEAYERSNRTLEAAVQALEKSLDVAGQGAAALTRKIIDIAQKNLNLGFDLAKSLAGARNLSEIVELQAAYWRKQFDAFTIPSEEVRDRLFEFGAAQRKTAEPSPESIHHEPAKKAPPHAQETPKKGHSPGAQRLKQRPDTQKLETPPTAGPADVPGVRPPDERQPGTRKRALRTTSLRGPQRAFLLRREGRKNLKHRGLNSRRDHLQVWSLRQRFVPLMKDNPGTEKRVLRKTSLFSKAFRPRSNLACLMGTLFALPTLRLGGWSMALGARSLQARFS